MTDEKAVAEKIMRKVERHEDRAQDECWCAVNEMNAAMAITEDWDLRRAEDLLRSALDRMSEARNQRARSASLALACVIVEGARDE